MNIICTVITGDYGHYVLALHDSIIKFNASQKLAVYISRDKLPMEVHDEMKKREIEIYDRSHFENHEVEAQLFAKYSHSNHDAYRWSMKPVFMNLLLNNNDKVIYIDSDIYFFNDYAFLFEELNNCSVLLSPHWRCSDPNVDVGNFKLNFLDGMYNGGFVGAAKSGKDELTYWAKLCMFNCEKNVTDGYFVDQKYLDILPSRFPNVSIIKHKGCNVANWNQFDCKRTVVNNSVLINGKFPIVFIHFTKSFFWGVLLGNDVLLKKHLESYRDNLLLYGKEDIVKNFLEKEIQKNRDKTKKRSIITYLNRLRLIIKNAFHGF